MTMMLGLIPILSWLLLDIVTGVLLLVPPPYRIFGIPAIALVATTSFRTARYLTFPPGIAVLWGIFSVIGIIHSSSLLYIKKWKLRTIQPIDSISRRTGIWINGDLLVSMYKVATNPRYIKVQHKSIVRLDDSTPVKSTAMHGKFSYWRILWLSFVVISFYLFNYLLSIMILTPTGFPLLKATLIRLWFTVNVLLSPILLLDTIHTALAVFFIYILRLDSPDEWPDLFGSPLEAYTLGRFWTIFWHRVHLSAYSDYVNLLISVLPRCIRRHTIMRKVLMISLIFLMSGLIHQLTHAKLYPGCPDYADIQFFSWNGAAVLLEFVLLPSLRRNDTSDAGKEGKMRRFRPLSGPPRSVLLLRLVGYVWVMGFFLWIMPTLYYSRLRCIAVTTS